MSGPEATEGVSTLDDLIVDIVSNDRYNKYVTAKIMNGGIDHPITDWRDEMRRHSSERYGLPVRSALITRGLGECARALSAERLERG